MIAATSAWDAFCEYGPIVYTAISVGLMALLILAIIIDELSGWLVDRAALRHLRRELDADIAELERL